MFIPILFGDETLSGAEYESSLFGKSQFDVAVKALTEHFRSLGGADAQALAAITKKILSDYVTVSLQAKRPYSQADLDAWIKRVMAQGYARSQALLFLSGLRKLHDSGAVGDAVWNPSAWSAAHPEDKSFLDGLASKSKSLFYYSLAAGAVLLFALAAPKGIAEGVTRGFRSKSGADK